MAGSLVAMGGNEYGLSSSLPVNITASSKHPFLGKENAFCQWSQERKSRLEKDPSFLAWSQERKLKKKASNTKGKAGNLPESSTNGSSDQERSFSPEKTGENNKSPDDISGLPGITQHALLLHRILSKSELG
jgi:hypothetical protein